MKWPVMLYLLLIFGLSSIPGHPKIAHAPIFIDKVAHFILYAGLGFVFIRFGRRRWNRLWVALVSAMLFVGLTGLIDELYQTLIPNRSQELADWFADLAGGTCGALVAIGLARMISSYEAELHDEVSTPPRHQ